MSAIVPSAEIIKLKGTAKEVADLVQEYAAYEFEGYMWLAATIEGIADKLGRHKNTIRNIIRNPPFHYITRNTQEDGRHILLKLGTERCETDYVYLLRAVWVRGLLHYNGIAANVWAGKLIGLVKLEKGKTFPKGKVRPSDRMRARIAAAKKKLPQLEKLKAGKKISLAVPSVQMGLLRGVVRALGEDAPATLSCLVTFDGWNTFCSYSKAEERFKEHYHWPVLHVIVGNPDIALQTYLDMLQAEGKADLTESARLSAKIAELTPKAAT